VGVAKAVQKKFVANTNQPQKAFAPNPRPTQTLLKSKAVYLNRRTTFRF
jgi:hypothetical protein